MFEALGIEKVYEALLMVGFQKVENQLQKNLQEYLSEFMKSDDNAKKALDFIAEKRGKKTSETLSFEKL